MGRTAHRSAATIWLTAALMGCVRGTLQPASTPARGALRAVGVGGRADPTEHGARVIPEAAGEDRTYGVEPSGGIRGIASGVRVINLPNGAALAAQDRLPQAPSTTARIPERLGGGFLFVIGNVVWRASSWLAPAKPIYSSPASITRLIVGLDRVYLRAPNGAHQAIDPRDGTALDLGPWPGSSFVGSYAALDGWRAVAVNDLRGVVATVDAGATWKPLGLPIDPQTVTLLDDAIAVSGTDALRQMQWFEVRDGVVSHLPAPPAAPVTASTERATSLSSLAPAARPFGARPLLAAIEDGWPLEDGTAVVARDGTLARVRLEDGALVDLAPDAFPMKPSRCHPFALADASGQLGDTARPAGTGDGSAKTGSFAFVCGEPRGRTILYAYDAAHGRLEELRRFSAPRVVLASGNGAVAVRGGCAEDAPGQDESRTDQSYCLLPRGGPWREIRVRNVPPVSAPASAGGRPATDAGASTEEANEVGDERVVVLGDGRVAIVSPPRGDLSTARLTLLDHDRSTTVPIAFTGTPSEVSHILRLGIWLDGMEERRPGVIGGWVEAAGAMLGVEIQLDGRAKTGSFVRDAGAPMVSGRYGLGWSASRRGYETTDGGMTWTPLDLPEPLALDQTVRVRACGPLGCTAKGWLRVGWGALANPTPTAPPIAFRPGWRPGPAISLDCEPAAPPPRPADESPQTPIIDFDPFTGGRRLAMPTDSRPFYAVAPPAHHADETLISAEASEPVERQLRANLLARVYAWGPKTEDWPHAGHWQARWLWPFGGWQELRSTQPGPAPFASADAARRGLVTQGAANTALGWTFAAGDDGAHALLFGRHGAETTVLELESERPIAQLYRVDGEPFAEVDSAVRASGRWYVATPQGPGELPAEVIWQVDGAGARELARVGRAALDSHASPIRLAKRSDGRFIGLVVDGQPPADRGVALRWVLSVDVESGALGEPEALGLYDMSDRSEVPPCVGDQAGWILDTPMAGTAHVRFGGHEAPLGNLYARLRWTPARVCMERLSGTADTLSPTAVDALFRTLSRTVARHVEESTISVSALATARGRYPFRCKR